MPANTSEVDMSNYSEIVNVYKTASLEVKKWERIRDDLKASIKEAMGDAKFALIDGIPVLKKTIVEQRKFDITLFKEEFPELAEKYLIPTSYITLTIMKPPDEQETSKR